MQLIYNPNLFSRPLRSIILNSYSKQILVYKSDYNKDWYVANSDTKILLVNLSEKNMTSDILLSYTGTMTITKTLIADRWAKGTTATVITHTELPNKIENKEKNENTRKTENKTNAIINKTKQKTHSYDKKIK